MKKPILAALLAIGSLSTAQAVSLSPDGRGQALIYPYYTAQGNNDTLFSVVNPISIVSSSGSPSNSRALKVRFLEGRNGRVVLDFNLYLKANRTWTAAITRNAAGNPILRTFDPACTVPRLGSGSIAGSTEIAFGNANYAGYDMAGSGLDRAKEGHFEVIEMGTVDESFALPNGKVLGDAINPDPAAGTQDCASVASAWNAGGAFAGPAGSELAAPAGGLSGHAFIINVPRGTEYSYDPVALTNLFAVSRHGAPGNAHPNLGDADPKSFVAVQGVGYTSTWTTGIDAVSAVLAHKDLINEYVGPPNATSLVATDVVVAFPTKSFYVTRESDAGQTTRAPFQAKFHDVDSTTGQKLSDGTSPGACETFDVGRMARDGRKDYDKSMYWIPSDPQDLCWQTNVVAIGNVLDSMNAQSISTTYIDSTAGYIYYIFYPTMDFGGPPPCQLNTQLVSIEGHCYTGKPVVGFALQHRLNGNIGGMIANYSGTSEHKYETEVQGK